MSFCRHSMSLQAVAVFLLLLQNYAAGQPKGYPKNGR